MMKEKHVTLSETRSIHRVLAMQKLKCMKMKKKRHHKQAYYTQGFLGLSGKRFHNLCAVQSRDLTLPTFGDRMLSLECRAAVMH